MTGGSKPVMTKEQQQFAMTKRGKLYNDKEGKAGVSVGKKYKYKDVGYRVCDCHACRRQARNDGGETGISVRKKGNTKMGAYVWGKRQRCGL